MTAEPGIGSAEPPVFSRSDYQRALYAFDAAVCEAIAVSQKQANQRAASYIGYATYVFARMCGVGAATMRATPLSRWVQADFHNWDFAAIAGYSRSMLEGHLLFSYLIAEPVSDEEVRARIDVMHVNDCTRRLELFTDLGETDQLADFEAQLNELRQRLRSNTHFAGLPLAIQKSCLNGKYLMIASRDEMLEKTGFKKGEFDALFDLWSQYTHILPLSFYRMEPNGRGTGLENEADRGYMTQALELCAAVLVDATDLMVEKFPETADVRRGIKSTFSPGPRANLPKSKVPRKRC